MEQNLVHSGVDRYVITEYLAEGGMGAIFLGKRLGMEGFEKEVVLKQLLPEYTSHREFIDLFLREAKLSASLDHANIVHTLDLVAAGEDYFIVMEYVQGGDLRTILRRIKVRGHVLAPAAALFIAREVLSALSYAHEKKGPKGRPLCLIHRDISPSNVMLSVAGEVKLTDFGIAKAATHNSVFYRVKGKVGYMSPEQAHADRPLDHRSDLYSLAVCLYEMLAGERLFVADLLTTPEQIYSQPILSLEDQPGIPPGVDRMLATALAIDPGDRFQNALDFQDALVNIAYRNAMLYSSHDLSRHLTDVCGEDQATWHLEGVEGATGNGTELLQEDLPQFSNVELTSIFTGTISGARLRPSSRDAWPVGVRDPLEEKVTQHVELIPLRREEGATRPAKLRGPGSGPAGARRPEGVSGPSLPALPVLATPFSAHSGPWAAQHPVPDDAALDEEPTAFISTGERAHLADRTPSSPAATRVLRASRGERRAGAMTAGEIDPGPVPPRAGPGAGLPARPGAPPIETSQIQAPDWAQEPAYVSRHKMALFLVGILLAGGTIVLAVGLTGPELKDSATLSGAGGRPGGTSLPESPPSLENPAPASSSGPADLGLPLSVPPLPDAGRSAPPGEPDPGRGSEQTEVTGSLRIRSTPSESDVYLDGVKQCRTPCTVEELERNRVYLLSLRREGHQRWSCLVDMKPQPQVQLSAYLSPVPRERQVGFLLLRSSPAADVHIDGKQVGRVTSEGRIPLLPGEYEVVLSHPRRRRQPTFVVTIQKKRTRSLRVRF